MIPGDGSAERDRLAAELHRPNRKFSAKWRAAVTQAVLRWHRFLVHRGLPATCGPTEALITAFAEEISERTCAKTAAAYLERLHHGLSIMMPDFPLDPVVRRRKLLLKSSQLEVFTRRKRSIDLCTNPGWPPAIWDAWLNAFCGSDDQYADNVQRPATWSRNRRTAVARGYGLFLAFLASKQINDKTPTPRRVAEWIVEMRSRGLMDGCSPRPLAAASIASYIEWLCAMAVDILDPAGDWEWLIREVKRLKHEAKTEYKAKNKFARLVSPVALIELAETLISEAHALPKGVTAAIRHRDGLMVALFAKRGLRLANVANIRIDRELILPERGPGRLAFCAAQMKGGRPFDIPLGELRRPIEVHISVFRPYLDLGRGYDSLFLSNRGHP